MLGIFFADFACSEFLSTRLLWWYIYIKWVENHNFDIFIDLIEKRILRQ